jgi:hypothetical protein
MLAKTGFREDMDLILKLSCYLNFMTLFLDFLMSIRLSDQGYYDSLLVFFLVPLSIKKKKFQLA